MSTLLVLGTLDASWLETIRKAAERADLGLTFARQGAPIPEEAIPDLRAVILGDTSSEALALAGSLRADARLEKVALLAIRHAASTSDFVASLTSGVDDLLTNLTDVVGLGQRLTAAREAGAGTVRSLRRGLALVVGGPSVRAAARARALGSAGFRAAVAPGEDAPWLREPRLGVVVWEPTEPTRALEAVRAAREAGVLCRFVLCLPGELAEPAAAECEKLEGVRVLPLTSPPDSVVFLVNEMAETTVQNQRASRRRLASTLVHFRVPGREDLGLSYNVSAGGLYVRTLAPPASGPVGLSVEVGAARAELSCEVAWSRALSHDGTATAPPGFGVKILEAEQQARSLLGTLGVG